jgi:hypothetical protein
VARLTNGRAFVKQPLTDSLMLNGGVGARNKSIGNTGGYDYRAGVFYDLGHCMTTTAIASVAQTSTAGNNGRAPLVLGVRKEF